MMMICGDQGVRNGAIEGEKAHIGVGVVLARGKRLPL